MTRDEAKWVLELICDRYSSVDVDRLSLTDAETDAIDMAIKALEHLDNIEAYMHDFDVTEEEAIKALERKRGEWVETSESIGWEEVECAECSVCGKTLVLGDYTMDDIKFDYNYCPNCGADMRGDTDER